MSIPLIETLGWRLRDVSAKAERFGIAPDTNRWFTHRGVYFDGDDPSNEICP